jgi:hypothetical protein
MMSVTTYQSNDETWYDYVDRVLTTALPYETFVDRVTSFQAEEWCRSTFGPRWSIGFTPGLWASRVSGSAYRFSFAKDEHLMWFRMRWQ